MILDLGEMIRATRDALNHHRLIAQSPERHLPQYVTSEGLVSPAGAAGVNAYEVLEEIPGLQIDRRSLLKAALIEHAHDVWLMRGRFSLVLERMYHPSRLPPKLFQWLRNRQNEPLNLHTFTELLSKVEQYT